jgi:hypothetical protein
MHAIGVPEGVTLLEFEKNPEEQTSEQEVQAPKEVAEGDVVECPDHTPCNFVKGKPRSIINLLIFEMQLKYYVIYIVTLSLGVRCKHLLHWLSNLCPDIYTLNPK